MNTLTAGVILSVMLMIGPGSGGISDLLRFSKDTNSALFVLRGDGAAILDKGRFVPTIKLPPPVRGQCCDHLMSAALSPDSRLVAYARPTSPNPRREALAIYDLDNQTSRDVLTEFAIWHIAWSPNGKHLAVVLEKGKSILDAISCLYLVDVASGNITPLIEGTFTADGHHWPLAATASLSWNPTGTQLILSSGELLIRWDSTSNTFASIGKGTAPSWSPSGEVIAFFGPDKRHCYTVLQDGREQTLLFSAPGGGSWLHAPQTVLVFPVVWSADGSRLLFHQEADENLITNIYEFELATRKSKKIASGSSVRVISWQPLAKPGD